MIKSELISTLVAKANYLPEKDITECVKLLLRELSNGIVAKKRIEIRGFGCFTLHYRPPRKAHNPKTKAHLLTQPKYSAHFKPGKEMRDRVNESRASVAIQADDRDEEDT